MRPPLHTRATRALVALGLALSTLLPGASLIGAAEGDLVLKAGTDQKTETLNPWAATTVVDYEVFTLNYDLLVGFGQDLEPVAGFATSWSSSDDKMTHTFKIRPDMKWSDGEPATAADASCMPANAGVSPGPIPAVGRPNGSAENALTCSMFAGSCTQASTVSDAGSGARPGTAPSDSRSEIPGPNRRGVSGCDGPKS